MRQPLKRSSSLFIQLLVGVLIGAAIALIVLRGFPEVESPTTMSSPERSEAGVVGIQTAHSHSAPEVGAQAPNFIMQDLNGRMFELNDLDGEVVLLNFWATWCGPCRVEMPLLEAYFRDYSDQGFVILAIDLGETMEEVQAFVDELGMTFPVLLDNDGRISALYRILGYPSSVFIDSTGVIQAIHIGILSETQLQESLNLAGLSL